MIMPSPIQLPEGYLDFFMRLESWQNEQQIILQKQLAPSRQPEPDFKNLHDSLINIIDMEIDTEVFRSIYLLLIDFLGDLRPDLKEQMDLIHTVLDSVDWNTAIGETLDENLDYFRKLNISAPIKPETLYFTFEHALRPFLRASAAGFYDKLIETGVVYWEQPACCPFCGSESHISRLRSEDGKRFMFCDRCFSEWEVRYLFCVQCGNDEPGTIQIMNLEDDNAHKLYLCEKCKSYLKTYDERQTLQSTDMFIASLQTVYLDMLAESKGYGPRKEFCN